MKIKKYFFLILLIFNSCQNKDENPIAPIEESYIIPLAVGNQWLGKAERIGNDGEIISSAFSNISVIAQFTDFDSTKISILQLADGQQVYCANYDSGFVHKYPGLSFLQFKYPGKIGEKYQVSGNSYREIISTDTTIITEYGKFKCYHYRHRIYDNELHTEEFVSPNIGFVYTEHYQTDGPTPEIFLYSRISYNPILKTMD